MKLLFDENLSFRLARALRDTFPGSAHLRDVGLVGAEDEKVWEFAGKNGFVLTSKDSDFYHRSILRARHQRFCGFESATPPRIPSSRRCGNTIRSSSSS